VPLAEEVNRIAIRRIRSDDVARARKLLLSIIENLARDEQAANMRMPSTRELGRLNGSRRRRSLRRM
jgi:hypothetical protein